MMLFQIELAVASEAAEMAPEAAAEMAPEAAAEAVEMASEAAAAESEAGVAPEAASEGGSVGGTTDVRFQVNEEAEMAEERVKKIG